MRYHEIFENFNNGTWQNALIKMAQGYLYGLRPGYATCYAYVGTKLAETQPPEALLRFWGRKNSGNIMHGDALLPDGTVISDIPVSKYRDYELVHEMTFDQFKDWVERSKKLN